MIKETTDDPLAEVTWLTRAEAAVHARVHVRTIDKWVVDGRLTKYTVKGLQSVRFKREEIDALMVPSPATGSIGCFPPIEDPGGE